MFFHFFTFVITVQSVGMFLSIGLTRLRDGVPPNIGHSLPISILRGASASALFWATAGAGVSQVRAARRIASAVAVSRDGQPATKCGSEVHQSIPYVRMILLYEERRLRLSNSDC